VQVLGCKMQYKQYVSIRTSATAVLQYNNSEVHDGTKYTIIIVAMRSTPAKIQNHRNKVHSAPLNGGSGKTFHYNTFMAGAQCSIQRAFTSECMLASNVLTVATTRSIPLVETSKKSPFPSLPSWLQVAALVATRIYARFWIRGDHGCRRQLFRPFFLSQR
jgi:hypothetical protein